MQNVKEKTNMRCKNCNAQLVDGANFCMECGTKVEKDIFCSQCGQKLPETAKFCYKCGARVLTGEEKENFSFNLDDDEYEDEYEEEYEEEQETELEAVQEGAEEDWGSIFSSQDESYSNDDAIYGATLYSHKLPRQDYDIKVNSSINYHGQEDMEVNLGDHLLNQYLPDDPEKKFGYNDYDIHINQKEFAFNKEHVQAYAIYGSILYYAKDNKIYRVDAYEEKMIAECGKVINMICGGHVLYVFELDKYIKTGETSHEIQHGDYGYVSADYKLTYKLKCFDLQSWIYSSEISQIEMLGDVPTADIITICDNVYWGKIHYVMDYFKNIYECAYDRSNIDNPTITFKKIQSCEYVRNLYKDLNDREWYTKENKILFYFDYLDDKVFLLNSDGGVEIEER
jgi:ribosomal protein L40E